MITYYDTIENDNIFKLHFQKMGKKLQVNKEGLAFDIETSTIIERDKKDKIIKANSYMYIATFGIGEQTISCRTWEEVAEIIDKLKAINDLDDTKKLIIWVANLSFEFQFMRKWIEFDRVVAKTKRYILLAASGPVEFRDALAVSGGNLDYLAKNFTSRKKMIGDLDYKKLRNSWTKLTPEEQKYIEEDVLILTDFHKYILKHFKRIPLTKTGIVRHDVKQEFFKLTKGFAKDVLQDIGSKQPVEHQYHEWFKWLFRGGYVHGHLKYINRVLNNIMIVDKKSSYPYQLLTKKYPIGHFKAAEHNYKYYDNIPDMCYYGIFEFYNIKSKDGISLESEHKVIKSDNTIVDNGRILKADYIKVMLTDIDLQNYHKIYNWERMECLELQVCECGLLPEYIRNVIKRYFKIKENTPKDTPEYSNNKANLNSIYGMMVTRLLEFDYEINEAGELEEVSADEYWDQVKGSVLLPQWGIWCTAHARQDLINLTVKLQECAYNDTDSCECVDSADNRLYIDLLNNSIRENNRRLLKEDYLLELGTWEIEAVTKRFKTLGAKRYIWENDEKINVTIAGLPKNALIKYCEDLNADIFDIFHNGLLLDIECADKLTSVYHDEPTHDYINGELMEERSSVSLVEIPFKMTIAEVYLHLIDEWQEHLKKREGR